MIRTRLPGVRTLPLRMFAAFSFCANVAMSKFLRLELNTDVPSDPQATNLNQDIKKFPSPQVEPAAGVFH
ncbi:MAG: hypothetical protein E6H55_01385 [Betaproteobacteria bacterium]|nr:MAG: hypothetical protein E6H55_01385 [Betaproteobacteria bacterium]